jgi:hypothetical protein
VEIKSTIILQPGPAALADGLDAIVKALWPDQPCPLGRHSEERSDEAIHLSPRGEVDCFARNDVEILSAYAFSTPHHSAINSAVAFVDFRNESNSTYSLKPCIAAPFAPKHRLGML